MLSSFNEMKKVVHSNWSQTNLTSTLNVYILNDASETNNMTAINSIDYSSILVGIPVWLFTGCIIPYHC
jgi:hypothetical protein